MEGRKSSRRRKGRSANTLFVIGVAIKASALDERTGRLQDDFRAKSFFCFPQTK